MYNIYNNINQMPWVNWGVSFLYFVREIAGCDIAYQTKLAIYKYLFDRNAPLCIIINQRNWLILHQVHYKLSLTKPCYRHK